MKAVVSLSCLLSISIAAVLPDSEWESYKFKYNKSYSGELDKLRRKIYEENINEINQHNQKYEEGLVSYYTAENYFTDLLESEMVENFMGDTDVNPVKLGESPPYKSTNLTLPSSIDWRDKNAVTPVKTQGHCGSCWVFSAVASIEGQRAIKTGKLESLSEEQIVECNKDVEACHGGSIVKAFKFIMESGGIESYDAYPYTAGSGEIGKCRFNNGKVVAKVKRYQRIQEDDESALQDAVANVGPIAVRVTAHRFGFKHYKGGVLCQYGCNPELIHHDVVVVGYGEDERHGPYWLLKNSWGTHWGDAGYIKICRGKDNEVCVAHGPAFPIL